MVKGLGNVNFKSFDNSGSLQIKDGETKQIRFLQDGNEIEVFKKHWVELNGFKGYIKCLNNAEEGVFDNCPLCDRAGGWGAPIGASSESLVTQIIDRTDGKAKTLILSKMTIEQMARDFTANGSITDVDYSFTRKKITKGQKTSTEYTLDALRQTAGALTPQDIELKATVDTEKEMDRINKSKEQILDIINVPGQSVAQPIDQPAVQPTTPPAAPNSNGFPLS